jgi:hypothetical protein
VNATATRNRIAHATVVAAGSGLRVYFYAKARRTVEDLVTSTFASSYREACEAIKASGIKSERVHWRVSASDLPAEISEGNVSDLFEGDVFSLDNGTTWHTCAVNMSHMGTVAVYVNHCRTDGSLTIRVYVEEGQPCIVKVR